MKIINVKVVFVSSIIMSYTFHHNY